MIVNSELVFYSQLRGAYISSVLFSSSLSCCLSSHFIQMFCKIFFFFPNYLFEFCLILLTMKRRSDDPIGGPLPLPRAQLPTHGDIAREWRFTRLEMQKAYPGTIVVNREVAKKVAYTIFITL